MKKTIGTFCDDYKLDVFLNAFRESGIEILHIGDTPTPSGTTNKVKFIKVFGDEQQIHDICTRIQAQYAKKYMEGN